MSPTNVDTNEGVINEGVVPVSRDLNDLLLLQLSSSVQFFSALVQGADEIVVSRPMLAPPEALVFVSFDMFETPRN
jgi:hypothetical protein